MMNFAYEFVIIFNGGATIEIPHATLQDCHHTQITVEENPKLLYYTQKGIDTIEFGCITTK